MSDTISEKVLREIAEQDECPPHMIYEVWLQRRNLARALLACRAERDDARAVIARMKEEKDILLLGIEEAGWPCRLAELPQEYVKVVRLLEESRAEVARLKFENECGLRQFEVRDAKMQKRIATLKAALSEAKREMLEWRAEIERLRRAPGQPPFVALISWSLPSVNAALAAYKVDNETDN